MKSNLRKENICLNCGEVVTGRFCTMCGQENKEPRESFGQLIYDFFADFTHFDSKLFTTLKYLFFRPAFLTKEYLAGRRMRYLHPIRMYIFISFVFFICLGLLNKNEHAGSADHLDVANQEQQKEIQAALDSIKAATQEGDTVTIKTATKKIDRIVADLKSVQSYTSVKEFDSVQNTLPPNQQIHGIELFIKHKQIAWNQKYGSEEGALKEELIHDIPKVMFILLPLFALFLQWFYRKGHYYVDHAIFSLHFHSFAFLLNLLLLLLARIFHVHFFERLFAYLLFLYFIIALRNMYHRSWVRSFFKGVWISLLYSFSIGIVFLLTLVVIFITA